MAEDTEDGLKLSTGKEIYAHAGTLGIGPELDLTYGFDGGIWDHRSIIDVGADALSKAELLEIADHAIARWQAFKALVSK